MKKVFVLLLGILFVLRTEAQITIVVSDTTPCLNSYITATSTGVPLGAGYLWAVAYGGNSNTILGPAENPVTIQMVQSGPVRILTPYLQTVAELNVSTIALPSYTVSDDEADGVLCPGQEVTFTVSGTATQYDWYRDGSLYAQNGGSTLSVTDGGTHAYTVVGTLNGCSYIPTGVFPVLTQEQVPTLDMEWFFYITPNQLSGNDTAHVCSSSLVSFEIEVTGAYYGFSVLWNTGSTDFYTSGVSSGTYTYQITTDHGCVYHSQDTGTVVGDAAPLTQPNASFKNCMLKVPATYETYQWYKSWGGGMYEAAIDGATSNTFSPTETAKYFCRLTKGGCRVDSKKKKVTPCGVAGRLESEDETGTSQIITTEIYNALGQKLSETKLENLPQGVYFIVNYYDDGTKEVKHILKEQ